MIQSFMVYGFLGLSLFLLGKIAAQRERIDLINHRSTPFLTWEILLSFFIFSLITGIRWNVGTDFQGYLEIYNDIHKGWKLNRNIEPGFLLITDLFANLNIHYTFYFGFLAFLQLFFFYFAFKDEKYLLPLIGVFIIFGGQYHMWVNGTRQSIAACIFVFSIHFIVKRQLFKYILTIFFASLFHQSALILLLFYFIPLKNYFKNKLFTTTLLIVSIFIGLTPTWLSYTNIIEQLFILLGYDNYATRLDFLITENATVMAFGPRRVAQTILYLILIWTFQGYYRKNKNNKILLFYNLMILGAIHHNLFANASNIFMRPTYYLTIFTPIITSYLLVDLYNREKKISLKYIMLFMIAISHLVIAIIADADKGSSDYINYKFFWDFV